MAGVPTLRLDNGVQIRRPGLGVYQIPPGGTVEAVGAALEIGYRHIDTAEMYGNEKEVGEAVRRSGIDRGENSVTSKLDDGSHAPDAALRAFDRHERTGPDPDPDNVAHVPDPYVPRRPGRRSVTASS